MLVMEVIIGILPFTPIIVKFTINTRKLKSSPRTPKWAETACAGGLREEKAVKLVQDQWVRVRLPAPISTAKVS